MLSTSYPVRNRRFTALPAAIHTVNPRVLAPDPSLSLDASVRRIANLEIRAAEFELLVDGRRAGLTVREFQTFAVLANRSGRVVPRAHIYQLVWGGPMARRDRSVDVFIRKVRGKLARVAPDWVFVHTHYGIGYRLSPERVADATGSIPRSDHDGAQTAGAEPARGERFPGPSAPIALGVPLRALAAPTLGRPVLAPVPAAASDPHAE